MTCIIGLVDRGRVWMAGDSAGVEGYRLAVRADEKVFRTGPFLIGFTTSFRMGQLLRYRFEPPRQGRESAARFMATRFVDAVRLCLKAGGWQTTKDEHEHGGVFLVGYGSRLYLVGSDYQVGQLRSPFYAVGCGADLALGSLHATPRVAARRRIRKALEAAECFSAGARRPFVIRSIVWVGR